MLCQEGMELVRWEPNQWLGEIQDSVQVLVKSSMERASEWDRVTDLLLDEVVGAVLVGILQ